MSGRKGRLRAARRSRVIAAYTRALETNLVTPEEFLASYTRHLTQSEISTVKPTLNDAYASYVSRATADTASSAIDDTVIDAEETRRPGFVSRLLQRVPYGRSHA